MGTKILLSCKTFPENYVNALLELGAEPYASYLPNIDTDYDGLILCGGSDIDPRRYGEDINGAVNIDYQRDEVEFKLLRAFVDAGKPVFGICRGFQLINVFFGGSLYQDIPEAVVHKTHNGHDMVHSVTAVADSIVARLHGESFTVNSSHHQAIRELGKDITATAFWDGMYVEAIEHRSLAIFGVQWHPERMCFQKQRNDTVCGADILSYFIDVCKSRRIN